MFDFWVLSLSLFLNYRKFGWLDESRRRRQILLRAGVARCRPFRVHPSGITDPGHRRGNVGRHLRYRRRITVENVHRFQGVSYPLEKKEKKKKKKQTKKLTTTWNFIIYLILHIGTHCCPSNAGWRSGTNYSCLPIPVWSRFIVSDLGSLSYNYCWFFVALIFLF